MKANHAIKIAIEQKGLATKVLLFRIVTYIVLGLLIFLLGRVALLPIIRSQAFGTDWKEFVAVLKTFVFDFFSPEKATTTVTFEDIQAKLVVVFSNFSNNSLRIVLSLIGIVLVLLVGHFLFALCDYVVGINVDYYMTSLMHGGFFTVLFEDFANACKFALLEVIVLLIYNVVSISICYLLTMLFMRLFGLFSLFFITLAVVLLISLRFTFLGHILPKMVCDKKKPLKAFRECFTETTKKLTFQARFITYFFLIVSAIVINVVFAVTTFYVGLLVSIPLTVIIFVTIRFIGYYTANCKKYYITFDEVFIPKELRQNDENLLNKVDI